jgi:hypothetical protein
VIFDTGSTDLLVTAGACIAQQGCVNKNARRFVPEQSKTYLAEKRSWTVTWGTGIGVSVAQTDSCSGTVGTDTVSVAGLTVTKQAMGLIQTETQTLFGGTEIEGILGMGFEGPDDIADSPFLHSLIAKQGLPPLFSLYLTPKSIGGAQLTIGGIDSTKFTGKINYLPIDGTAGYWRMNSGFQKVTVNGQRSPVTVRSAIADSGTSNMAAPPRDAKAIYAQISPKIQMLHPRGAYGIECSLVPGLKADIAITMGGVTYTIPTKEFIVGPFPGMPGYCQTLINSPSDAPDVWIIGGSLLKYYYTVWDIGNRRLGFATTAHSPLS